MSSTKSTIGNFLTILLNYPITILVGILITRNLGAHDKGVYVFLTLISGTILPIMLLGFGAGVIYFISKEIFNKQEVFFTCILIGAILGVVSAALIYILIKLNFFSSTTQNISFYHFYLILLTLPIEGILLLISYYLKGSSQFKYLNLIDITRSLLLSILLIFLVLIFQLGLEGVVYSLVITKTIIAFFTVIFLYIKDNPKLTTNINFINQSFRYGIKSWLGAISTTSNARMDQLLLSIFATPSLLGIFAVANSIVELLKIPSLALSPVLFNKMSKISSKEELVVVTGQVNRSLLLITAISSIFIILLCPLIPFIYGKDFTNAIYPLLILLPGLLFYSSTRIVITKFLAATGNPLKTSAIQAVGAVTGIVFYFFLIPSFDILGAAIASTLSYLASTFFALYLFKKETNGYRINLFGIEKTDLIWVISKIEPILKLNFFSKKG